MLPGSTIMVTIATPTIMRPNIGGARSGAPISAPGGAAP
jgi:hypothetical protein